MKIAYNVQSFSQNDVTVHATAEISNSLLSFNKKIIIDQSLSVFKIVYSFRKYCFTSKKISLNTVSGISDVLERYCCRRSSDLLN